MLKQTLTIAILITCLLLPPLPAQAQDPVTAPRVAFSAYRNGQWDLYSISPDGNELRQLTNDIAEDADPAYSPDGRRLAFASRRGNNWDVYILDLQTGSESRLTDSPHYQGAPAWHPDGNSLAYESFETGDLDIWLMDAAASEPAINLTAEPEAGDFAPAFSPDGESLAFTSWRRGDKDLFLLTLANGAVTRLTSSTAAEEQPVWQPNGQTLTFVQDDLGDREIFGFDLAELPAEGGLTRQLSWLGRTEAVTWLDSVRMVALFQRWDGQQLMLLAPDNEHRLPQPLTGIAQIRGPLSWQPQAIDFGKPIAALVDTLPTALFEEQLTPNETPGAEPYNLVRQNDIDTGTPWLADTVDDSFQAWRQRITSEVGFDFLQKLSDASRDVAAYTETSQYASWHKSGRAIDTLFDFYLNGQLMHEIVREDYSGETYWRVYLRCLDQSGACGRPLTATPWNYTYTARTELGPEQGGTEKANISGYYVDMTALAREYGWERISSYDDVDYSWTWHFLAFEYWHYQKRLEEDANVGNWYQAMQQIYPDSTLQRYFNWERMRSLGDDPHLIALKGVPLPLAQRPWWAMVQDE